MIAEQLASWGHVPAILPEVFGTADGDAVEAAVDAFCEDVLASPVAAHELFATSSKAVHGVRLRDGRRVVVQVSRPHVSLRRLRAAQAVQRHAAAAGFPAPEPLVAPTPLGTGMATVEAWLAPGEVGDAHAPELRRSMARSLARLVALCRPLVGLDGLEEAGCPAGALWPEPHDARFDFQATAHGAEWIDAVARRARAQIGQSERVVGHRDWRAENVRFSGGDVVAVYDWDSACAAGEAELAGAAAHYFPSDFRQAGRRQLPTLDEALAFLADYERARGAPFSAREQRTARAAIVAGMAYTARCEHSDALTDFGRLPASQVAPPPPEGSARAFLVAHGDQLLDS